ncbi:MAG: hypothetical protein D4R57_01760 [Verrucomicrobiales bacterium]|nr:MAG: hypothetical protein D4R57_01760 [Verrucomicrobiales bacterium]
MATEPQSKPSFTPRRKWGVGFDVVVRTFAVLAVIVMLNHLAGKFFHRKYLSESTKVELSSRTRNFLNSLTNEVKVTIYFNREDEFYPTIAALLREYHALNPRVSVETVDYLRDAAEALRLKQKHKLPNATKDEEKNFVIFECEGRSRIILGEQLTDKVREIDWEKKTNRLRATAFRGETVFTAYLIAVTNPKPYIAYVLQGHGEHDLESGDEYTGYLDFKSLLQQNYVQVELLSLIGTNTAPQDCNLLIIPGSIPAVTVAELQKLDQYFDEGGRALILFNSASFDRKRGLETILEKKWRVKVGDDAVSDKETSIDSIKAAPGKDITVAAFSKHQAANALMGSYLNLYRPRSVDAFATRENTADVPKVERLFATTTNAMLEGRLEIAPRQYSLAVAVEKNAVRGVVTGRGNTRMIIVGDSFFFANEPMKTFANREFAGYALNWLLDRPQFTEGIGPKPFTEFRITLTTSQMNNVRWLLIAALPGAILLFGGLVWLRRRN